LWLSVAKPGQHRFSIQVVVSGLGDVVSQESIVLIQEMAGIVQI
jgi:hypothetical protein